MSIEVAAAIIERDGKYLIAKRAQHKPLAGYWEFPGGKIEKDETPEHCLLRELKEELSIQVEVLQFIAENTHDYGTFTVCLKAYRCLFIEGEFTLVDHEEIAWISLEQMNDYQLAPADFPFVKVLENMI